jgi:MFS family permease
VASVEDNDSSDDKKWEKTDKPSLYAWFVLFQLFMAQTIYHMNRLCIGYAFGFQGIGAMANSKYMMTESYPQINKYYGVVSSLLFSIPFSFSGIFSGMLSATVNRKNMLGLAIMMFSTGTFLSGSVNSFVVFCLMRIALGIFGSTIYPTTYGLVSEYFPPAYRSTGIGIVTSGAQFGAATASFSIILIKLFGWRMMYEIMGAIGVFFGLSTLLFVKEPPRGVYATVKPNKEDKEVAKKKSPLKAFISALSTVTENKVSWNITIAGMLRKMENFAASYYLPAFFQRVYPSFKMEYSLYNGLIIATFGFLSNLISGIICDKLSEKSKMSKAWVCILGGLSAIIPIGLCCLTTGNFYLSLFFMAVKLLLSEGWVSPSITMIQDTVSAKKQGSVVSGFLFFMTIAGTFGTVSLGQVANMLGAAKNPAIYG